MPKPPAAPFYFYTTASPFSQFHPAKFLAPLPTFPTNNVPSLPPSLPETHTFFCAEQYMMVSKALLFSDFGTARAILAADSPKACKALGRQVQGFDEGVWVRHREQIVEQGSWWKFTRAEGLRGELMATGERELVEASPSDRIWGIGFRESQAEGKRDRWGLNLLGKALMKVRQRMRDEEGNAAKGGGESSGGAASGVGKA